MKKYFVYALAATAGLFASCSSDELVEEGAASRVNDNARAKIELTVGTPAGVTRGSGTVGGLNGATDNVWAGQKINLYMLVKNTLDVAQDEDDNVIYEDAEMTTPNDATGAIRMVELSADGTTETETYSYFPQEGSFDFWAYRLDDAKQGTPAVDGNALKADFVIDGSQDIMIAKAEPTNTYNEADDTYEGTVAVAADKVFSAYSVRRNVKPNLKFKHLLTRLQFEIKGALQSDCDNFDGTNVITNPNAVKVKKIEVKSKSTGKLIVAYTGDEIADAERIEWDMTAGDEADGYEFLPLKQRTVACTTKAELEWRSGAAYTVGQTITFESGATVTIADNTPVSTEGANASAYDGKPVYNTTFGEVAPGTTVYLANVKNVPAYDTDADVTAALSDLEAVSPQWDTSNGVAIASPVGEALLVSPTEAGQGYTIKITMEQTVNKKAITTGGVTTYETKTIPFSITKELLGKVSSITDASGVTTNTNKPFEAAHNYKVTITVNGVVSADQTTIEVGDGYDYTEGDDDFDFNLDED